MTSTSPLSVFRLWWWLLC